MEVRNHNIIFWLACCVLIAGCFIPGCKPPAETDEQSISSPRPDTLPADFVTFYKAFHQDSAFQIQHITFPLPGMMQDTAGQDSAVVWQAVDWKMHRAVTADSDWAIDFTSPAEGVIVEFIYARDGSFWMERRFARSTQDWYLIYYSGLNQGIR
jgi:hypothetical protein